MATLSFFVYQRPTLATTMSLVRMTASPRRWSLIPESRDAMMCRARSISATRWLLGRPDDDVLVMSDDDFQFTVEGIDSLVDLANEKRGIVAGVTPLRTGAYTAIVPLDDSVAEPWRDSREDPCEIKWAGGLIAYHRSVFEALSKAMPLLHRNDTIEPFFPFFMPAVYSHPTRGPIYLSEDYACHERARTAGFKVWVQPRCQVDHVVNNVLVTTRNMGDIRRLCEEGAVLI